MSGEKFGNNVNTEPIMADSSGETGDDFESERKEGIWRRLGKKVCNLFNRKRGRNEQVMENSGDDDEYRVEPFDEKVKRLGYSKDKFGNWINKQGELVPGFELDEKYPEVAEMYEKSIEKYFGRYKSQPDAFLEAGYRVLNRDLKGGYKTSILKNIKIMSEMKSEDWDNAAAISVQCGQYNYYNVYTELSMSAAISQEVFHIELEKNIRRRQTLDEILEKADNLDGNNRFFLSQYLFPRIMNHYCDEARKEGFTDAIADFVTNNSLSPVRYSIVVDGIQGILDQGGGEFLSDYFKLLNPLLKTEEYTNGTFVPSELIKKIDSNKRKNILLSHQVRNHGMNANTRIIFERIFKMIDDADEEVQGIGDDFATSRRGYFGVDDYVIECLSSKSGASEIDRLVRIHNEIPTSDFAKREQNRKDAISIEKGGVVEDRTFIHEEYAGVHEIISAMVDYYDAPENLKEEKRLKIEELSNKYRVLYMMGDEIPGLDKYDAIVEGDGGEEKVINVLRRLKANTEPVPLSASKTKNEKLNEAMKGVNPLVDEKTGEIRVSLSDVGEAISIINEELRKNNGQIGIFPSTISAIAFLDRMAACAIRGIDKKEWSEVAFDPEFKEIVRFSQMTSSLGYHEDEFERFYNGFLRETSKGFEENGVDDDLIRDGYRVLSEQIGQNMRGLAEKYSQSQDTERYVGALWSGNLAHELIGMFDKKF